MVIDFFNINGGGSGGTVDYATSADTSNKTKLLEGVSSLPQDANEGDVIAGANTPTRGGAKSRSAGIETALYQYTNGEWQKVEMGGETEAPSFLKAQSEMPEGVDVGDVYALAYDSYSFEQTGAFVNNNHYNVTWDSNPPQAILTATQSFVADDTRMTIYLNKNGEEWKNFTATYTSGGIETDVDFIVPNPEGELIVYDGETPVAVLTLTEGGSIFVAFIVDSDYSFYRASNDSFFNIFSSEYAFTANTQTHVYQVVDDGEGGLTTVELATKNDIPSGGTTYELPIASSQILGGVKVGNNLTIDSGGTLSTSGLVVGSGITTIVKIYQSDYDALVSGGTADASTLYVVLPDPIPVIVVTNMSTSISGEYKKVSFFDGDLYVDIINNAVDDSGNTTQSAFTVSYDDNEGELVFTGDFPLSGVGIRFDLYNASGQTEYDTCSGDDTIVFSRFTASTAFDVNCVHDYQAECEANYGCWDGENCLNDGDTGYDECACESGAGTWVEGYGCDYECSGDLECLCSYQGGCWDSENQTCLFSGDQGYDECNCVANGGTWDGNDCQYGGGSSDPDYCDDQSADYDQDACNCVSDGGSWEDDGNGGNVCVGYTNEECNAGGSDYNLGACECIHNGGIWVEGAEPSDSYCDYGGGEPDYCDDQGEDYNAEACDCETAGGSWEDDGEGNYYCECSADPGCECVRAGGIWDDMMSSCDCEGNQECECKRAGGSWEEVGPDEYACICGENEECDCEINGGEWVVPEIGDPYCDYGAPDYCDDFGPDYDPDACNCINNGGEWMDDGEGNYFCECFGDPECDCLKLGGTWTDDLSGNYYCDGINAVCWPYGSDYDEDGCNCVENGGTWDGSSCTYPE